MAAHKLEMLKKKQAAASPMDANSPSATEDQPSLVDRLVEAAVTSKLLRDGEASDEECFKAFAQAIVADSKEADDDLALKCLQRVMENSKHPTKKPKGQLGTAATKRIVKSWGPLLDAGQLERLQEALSAAQKKIPKPDKPRSKKKGKRKNAPSSDSDASPRKRSKPDPHDAPTSAAAEAEEEEEEEEEEAAAVVESAPAAPAATSSPPAAEVAPASEATVDAPSRTNSAKDASSSQAPPAPPARVSSKLQPRTPDRGGSATVSSTASPRSGGSSRSRTPKAAASKTRPNPVE
jgi:hypothetical protein